MLLTTQPVLASVNGTFSGSTITDLSCSSPVVPGGFPEPTTITITLSTGITSGVVNSVSMSSNHFTFNSSSAGSYTDTTNLDGSISLTGSIDGNMTVTFGDINTDGSYSGASFSFNAILNTNGILDLVATTDIFYGGTPCSSGSIAFTSLPSPLTGGAGGADIIVNPAITPGSIITTPQILRTQVRAITSDIQQRINDVMRLWQLRHMREGSEPTTWPPGEVPPDKVPEKRKKKGNSDDDDSAAVISVKPTGAGVMVNTVSGINAGDSAYLYGAWVSYSYVDFNNDFAATAFDGHRHGGLTGIDISPRENVLLGLAAGYEDNTIDTDFNRGHQQTDGFTIAPYFGALLTDTWSLNASAGYSSLSTDQFRTLPGTTTQVTSSPDHDRWFATVNLNGLTTYGNWVLGGQLGFLYALDSQNTFVESDGTQIAGLDSRLGQFNVGGEAAYSLGAYEPFARFSYEYDLRQTKVGVIGGPQPSFDDDDVLLGFGVRYFGMNNLTGNLEINTRLGREDYNEYSLTGTIRYEW